MSKMIDKMKCWLYIFRTDDEIDESLVSMNAYIEPELKLSDLIM